MYPWTAIFHWVKIVPGDLNFQLHPDYTIIAESPKAEEWSYTFSLLEVGMKPVARTFLLGWTASKVG